MEKFGPKKHRKVRSIMNTIAVTTHDSTSDLAERLRIYGAKMLASVIGSSPRTPKNWLEKNNAPTWKHTVIMLNHDELCGELLKAAGREDLAEAHETITKLRAALAAVEPSA